MSHRWTCTLLPGHDGPCKPGKMSARNIYLLVVGAAIIVVFMLLSAQLGRAATMECRWKSFGVLSCEMQAPPPISKASFCDVMQRATGGPFRWAREDTRQTKEQADKINSAGKALCGWGKSK